MKNRSFSPETIQPQTVAWNFFSTLRNQFATRTSFIFCQTVLSLFKIQPKSIGPFIIRLAILQSRFCQLPSISAPNTVLPVPKHPVT